ncbi:hypothetical protein JCM11491_001199 [Sporobolomyces phaffii]
METWTDAVSDAFLALEWSCSSTSSTNLLIKLLYLGEPRQVSLLATDLHGVYYESLKGRQLNRRIDDAVGSSSPDTQAESVGVMAGVGQEGEELAERVVEELVDAVRSGRARAELSEEGFQQFVDVTLPSETVFRFVVFKLEAESAQILASHLIQPLLGTSTALLSLLRHETPDEKDLVAKLEPAIDSSGRAERLSEGTSCSTFFRVGGAGVLKRWEQSMTNVKLKRNDPLQLSLPAPSPRKKASQPPAEPSSRVECPPSASSPPTASLSPSKRTGLASKMLDHRSKSAGERVGWDDSQPSEPSLNNKGKARATDDGDAVMAELPRRGAEDEDDEPATDEEADLTRRSDSTQPPASQPRERDRLRPPAAPKGLSTPSPSVPRPTMPRSYPPTADDPPPPPSQEEVEDKKTKKRRKAEEEEAAALEQRRAKFARLKAGSAGSSATKKRAGTRGL